MKGKKMLMMKEGNEQ